MISPLIKLRRRFWLPIRRRMLEDDISVLGVHLDGQILLSELERARAMVLTCQSNAEQRPELPQWEGYVLALSWVLKYGSPESIEAR